MHVWTSPESLLGTNALSNAKYLRIMNSEGQLSPQSTRHNEQVWHNLSQWSTSQHSVSPQGDLHLHIQVKLTPWRQQLFVLQQQHLEVRNKMKMALCQALYGSKAHPPPALHQTPKGKGKSCSHCIPQGETRKSQKDAPAPGETCGKGRRWFPGQGLSSHRPLSRLWQRLHVLLGSASRWPHYSQMLKLRASCSKCPKPDVNKTKTAC